MANNTLINISLPNTNLKTKHFGVLCVSAFLDNDFINVIVRTMHDTETITQTALEILKPHINKTVLELTTADDLKNIEPFIKNELFFNYDNDIKNYEAARAAALKKIPPYLIGFNIPFTGMEALTTLIDIIQDSGLLPANHRIDVWAVGEEIGLLEFTVD